MRKFIAVSTVPILGFCLSGCAGFVSFAPPRLEQKITEEQLSSCLAGHPKKDHSEKEQGSDEGHEEEQSSGKEDLPDLPQFLKCTQMLHARYTEVAAELANGQQAFDLPIIGLASSALSAAAFNKKPDLVKRSAVAIVTLTGLRTYYQAEPRRLLILQAGTALRCVYQASNPLRILDRDKVEEWRVAYNGSKDYTSTISAGIQKYGRLVLSTQGQVESAVYEIEDQLQRKLTSPTAPVISGFGTDYDALLQKLKVSEAVAKETTGAAQTEKSRLVGIMTVRTTAQEAETKASDLLLDQELLEDLDTLDDRLKVCTSLMSA